MNYIKFSPDKEKILRIFKKNNVDSLWHFTDINNLPLIKKLNGLRSKEFLENNGYLKKVKCGGDGLSHKLDKMLGNWNKISLNFTPYTPMAYYKKQKNHLVFIEIDPMVATFEDVYFTDCNAARTKNSQNREKGLRGLSFVRFDIINGRPKPYDKDWIKYVQAEILVPDYISLKFFKKIYFISEASLRLGEYLWGNKEAIFAVNPQIFADYNYDKWTITNPYVKKVIITNTKINKNSNISKYKDIKFLKRGEKFWINILLFATAGIKAKVELKEGEGITIYHKEVEFEKESNWWWTPSFKLDLNYPKSYMILEISLNEILWYKEKKRVL